MKRLRINAVAAGGAWREKPIFGSDARHESMESEGNITNLKITNRSMDFFEMMIDVEVKDVKHLTNIIAALRATPAINTVERARG